MGKPEEKLICKHPQPKDVAMVKFRTVPSTWARWCPVCGALGMPLEGGNGSLAALQWALCSEGSSSKSSRGPKGGICGKAIPGEVPVSMDRDMLGDRIPTGKSPADVLLEAAQKCVDALDISIPQHMYKKVLKLKKAIAAKKDWDVRLRASFKKAMESPDVSDSLEQCFGVE